MGVVLALLPLLPGIATRRVDWLFAGYVTALFTPFQTGVASASVVVIVVLVARQHKALIAAVRTPGTMFFLVAYLIFLCAQWAAGYGVLHTPFSIGASVFMTVATPVAVLLLGWRLAREERSERWMDLAASIIVAEALVIVLLPLCIGKPVLLAAAVNGILKPVYTVLGVSHTFPWYDPDWNQGSISIVNYSTVVMTLGAMHFFVRVLRMRRAFDAVAMVLLIFAAFMGENAMAVGAAGAAFAITLVIGAALRFISAMPATRNENIRTAVLLLLMITGVWGFLKITYLGNGVFAGTQKGRFYETVGSRMSERPLRMLLGYGAGAYGSRIAYARLGADPYEISTQLKRVYGIAILDTTFASSDYARDFRMAASKDAEWVGSSQGLMVSGLVSIAVENGGAGVLLLLLLSWPMLRRITTGTITASLFDRDLAVFGIAFLILLSVFFNYNEIPTATAVLLFPACFTGFAVSANLGQTQRLVPS